MPLGKAAEYGYLSARCHVLRSQLISSERLKELTSSRSIGEFVSGLSMTYYAPFIKETSAEGVHKGLSAAFEYQRKKLIGELNKKYLEIFILFFNTKYTLLDKKTANSSVAGVEEIFGQVDRDYIVSLEKSIRQLPASPRRQVKKIVGSYGSK